MLLGMSSHPSALLPILLAGCAARIPAPEGVTLAGSPPGARVERACWIEFARDTMPRRIGVAHGAVAEDVPSTQSGLLVSGPGGTWLIEGGMALDVPHQIDEVGGMTGFFLHRASADTVRVSTPEQGVRDAGVELTDLTGLLPTHGHWDHLGGLLSLPDIPIWMPQAEIDEAKLGAEGGRSGVTPNDARAVLPRARALTFEGGPLWAWDRSHDLMGDGSVLVVPMPGHSPGSVGVRVALPDGREAFLVGDAVWLREGYERREPKSWIVGSIVDADKDATATQVALLWALHQAEPDIAILPAHDRRSWVEVFGAPGCR
jgi:N-acyl homoserine lactone hydrolase